MAKRFDRLLDRATDPTLLEPNWMGVLDCVDSIRSNETQPKIAIQSIMKRYHNDNPHVAHYALLVLEAAVKNSGAEVHKVVATREVMEDLKHMAYDAKSDKVKEKILELIGSWAHAFKTCGEYKIIVDTHNLMQLEGFQFPAVDVSEAMFTGESAPQWVDADNCLRCRAAFGVLTRKHHCRACGQIFCDKCSGKQIELPHIGIEHEVRVCEPCHDKYSRRSSLAAKSESEESSTTLSADRPPLRISAEIDARRSSATAAAAAKGGADDAEAKQKGLTSKEQEELDMAMAISQSEADEKERQRRLQLYNLYNGPDESAGGGTNGAAGGADDVLQYKGVAQRQQPAESPQSSTAAAAGVSRGADDVDAELARYLDRDYWQKRKSDNRAARSSKKSTSPSPSAPPAAAVDTSGERETVRERDPAGAQHNGPAVVTNGLDCKPPGDAAATGDEDGDDTQKFAEALKHQVEVFTNRIRSNEARGRSILNDSSIQAHFTALTDMHAELLRRMQACDEQRAHYESLQDRLAHIGDARHALDALRAEHEKQTQIRLAEEQRRRQAAMLHQLDVMRQKKHEMLEQQRQAALARFQQQQHELNMRRYAAAQPVPPPPPPQQQQQQHVYNGAMPPSADYYAAMQAQQQHQLQQQQQYVAGGEQAHMQQQLPAVSAQPAAYYAPPPPGAGQPQQQQVPPQPQQSVQYAVAQPQPVHYAQAAVPVPSAAYGHAAYGQQQQPPAPAHYAPAAPPPQPQVQQTQPAQAQVQQQPQQQQPAVQQTVAAQPQPSEPVVGELISFD